MNKEAKFKRGNLVHINKILGPGKSHFEKDRDVIIIKAVLTHETIRYEGSDWFDNYYYHYTVMFPEDGNTISWYREDELILIDEGGEHLIKETEAKLDCLITQQSDIDYIISILDSGELSSTSIITLFNLIGYDCRGYTKHGEYYCLYSDANKLYPAFLHIKNSKTFEEAANLEFLPIYIKFNIGPMDIKKCFEAFHKAIV